MLTRMDRSTDVDLAMLDINLAGQLVFPVAEILRDRNIPFLFSTGYGASGLAAEFAMRPILHKPYSQTDLEAKIVLALTTPPGELSRINRAELP
ncbi:CheY family response regulator [Pseudomonas psychrotolerans L19]|uniref:hypothetical protein n=1 Tax=Pseudomonas oryzihabitans TaxID=47885 RepID=UPI00023A25BF|nr:hypothetical protein [Pseudomonas psychrotolerans]EHK71637.1 CheY family response regulator [Pseudomonas psychrotolerans L19]